MDRRTIKEQLLAAYQSAHFELCQFGRLHVNDQGQQSGEGQLPYPTNEKEVTPFILERTGLYRNSWLVPPLAAVLDTLGFHEERMKLEQQLAEDERTWSNRFGGHTR